MYILFIDSVYMGDNGGKSAMSHEECTPGDAYYVCQNCESDDDL